MEQIMFCKSLNWKCQIKCVILLLINMALSVAIAEDAYEVTWSRQLGTSADDQSYSVALDSSGNAFIVGSTQGSLAGANPGGYDGFLAKYDPEGNLIWTWQIGTSGSDYIEFVAVDGSDNIFIIGNNPDDFLSKYDPAGNLLWTKQIDMNPFLSRKSVAIDVFGNSFVSGGNFANSNEDAILAKYDPEGNHLWTRQYGTGDMELSNSVATDNSGNAVIAGYESSDFFQTSYAFIAMYDPNGILLWSDQLDPNIPAWSESVAMDSFGNAFISGSTYGSLGGPNAGAGDTFLAKYDHTGRLLWIRQFGTSANDFSHSVAVDSFGNAVISGETKGSLGGTYMGYDDAFLAMYDPNGNLLRTGQIGTGVEDISTSVAVDDYGNAFISGRTRGSLAAPNKGEFDAFLIKFATPEPCNYNIIGDLDENCKVDNADFVDLASEWQVSYDINDLAEMGARWLVDCGQTPSDQACGPKCNDDGICDLWEVGWWGACDDCI